MDQNPNNSQEKDNLKESCEHFDESNGKDVKNIEEKMQKLEIEGRKNQMMEGQMESEKCNEAEKKDYVPNWVIESLAFVKRKEMANSGLSTSSSIFHRLCEPKLHGDVEPHMVGTLKLEGHVHSGNMRAIALYGGQSLPIPSTPPPDYISGFKHINILFLDDLVLEFIKCILSKLNGIRFEMKMDLGGWQDERSRAIQCMLNMLADQKFCFYLGKPFEFKMLNIHFPYFINKCQCLRISYSIQFQKPEFDGLFEWLTNRPQMDATKQKIFMLMPGDELAYFLGRIKEEFFNATEPLNFLIFFLNCTALSAEYDLNLENGNTGEVLNSYGSQSWKFGGRIILRCPKGQEERWEKEGKQKVSMFTGYSDDVTHFELDI